MEWISVKKQLPTPEEDVLLYTDSGIIEGSLDKTRKYRDWNFLTLDAHGCGCCASDADVVTHWAKIPDLPKSST